MGLSDSCAARSLSRIIAAAAVSEAAPRRHFATAPYPGPFGSYHPGLAYWMSVAQPNPKTGTYSVIQESQDVPEPGMPQPEGLEERVRNAAIPEGQKSDILSKVYQNAEIKAAYRSLQAQDRHSRLDRHVRRAYGKGLPSDIEVYIADDVEGEAVAATIPSAARKNLLINSSYFQRYVEDVAAGMRGRYGISQARAEELAVWFVLEHELIHNAQPKSVLMNGSSPERMPLVEIDNAYTHARYLLQEAIDADSEEGRRENLAMAELAMNHYIGQAATYMIANGVPKDQVDIRRIAGDLRRRLGPYLSSALTRKEAPVDEVASQYLTAA
ncbi:hypothetical protein JXB02_04390 [Candidatus Woesearchaeota archaeon]|nr:hypothetical protein [Candidatus Woesearchaeota archaeon]